MYRRRLSSFGALAVLGGWGVASALLLAGCASADDPGDGRVRVVASTDVYGQIAEEVGAVHVDVSAIISSAAQDPHSFEPSVRNQLETNRADLVIENGGGYDAFMEALVRNSESSAPVITAVEFAPSWSGEQDDAENADDHDDHDHIEGFNEHVWYDPSTMASVAGAIAGELSDIDPAHAQEYAANAAQFASSVDELTGSLAEIAVTHTGTPVFATEPVSGYLLAAAGLDDVTPSEFSQAVEEGHDVPPATLLESLRLISDGSVAAVVVNPQTGGPETGRIRDASDAQEIPVLSFTETLPAGLTYLGWMRQNIDDLAEALAR